MRIACLVTVCAAFSSTLRFAKAVNLDRRSESETRLVERDSEGAENGISSEVKSILVQPMPVTAPRRTHPGAHAGGFRKSRAIRPNRGLWRGRSLNRLRLDRQRRHLQRSNARSIITGRSYDINENQIETIQSSEAFEPGAIRIEPMYRVVKKKNVLDKIVDIVRSVVNPSKSLGPLVGPIHVPGLGEKVFVRLLEPLESKHLVIRVVTNLPVPEIESSFHQTIFPAPGVVEHVEIPAVDHSSPHLSIDPVWSLPNYHSHVHSSLATGSVHSSSNHVVRVAQPTSSGLKQTSNNPSEILHDPRIPKVKLKYSEPIGESGHSHHDQLFSPNGAYHGSVHYQNKDRQSETSGTSEQNFGSSESTENKSNNEKFQRDNQFQDSSYYLVHPDQHRDKFTSSWNRSNIEIVSNVEDAEAGESLNPLYVANVDVPPLGAGTRTGRVASLDGSFSTSRPETETAFRIVKAPILLPTMASHLHLSQNFSSNKYANTDAPFRPMKYLNSNSSVWSSKPRASSEYGNGSGYTLFLGNGTTQNVPIPANLYSEAIRRRDSRIREIVKLTEDIRRNLNKTQTKRNVNVKSFEMFPRLINKTSNVTVANKNVGVRMNNVPARNVSVTKVSSRKVSVTKVSPRNVPVPKVSSRKVSSIPKVSSRNMPTYNVSLRNVTIRNVQVENSSKNANVSHEKEGLDCVKCQDSKEYENFESDEYEDYYYDDETDISNSTQPLTKTPIFSTTLKSLLSSTSTEPTVERANLKSQPDSVHKNSTASKVD